MKLIVFSIILGSVLLYFFNIALLKTPILDLDWSLHAALRFSAGFFILGISYFYANALTFKHALYITACILIVDYIYDYNIAAYRLNFEIILHGFYMLIWGAILGYLTARHLK